MNEITSIIAVVALLMSFWREYKYYQLRGDYCELDDEIDAICQDIVITNMRFEQMKEDNDERADMYGEFTERLLEAQKDK